MDVDEYGVTEDLYEDWDDQLVYEDEDYEDEDEDYEDEEEDEDEEDDLLDDEDYETEDENSKDLDLDEITKNAKKPNPISAKPKTPSPQPDHLAKTVEKLNHLKTPENYVTQAKVKSKLDGKARKISADDAEKILAHSPEFAAALAEDLEDIVANTPEFRAALNKKLVEAAKNLAEPVQVTQWFGVIMDQ